MNKRKFSSAFKVKVALEAIRGQKTLRELSQQYSLHPQQISLWKQQALDNMQASFDKVSTAKQAKANEKELEQLYEQIGRLQMANMFLKKKL